MNDETQGETGKLDVSQRHKVLWPSLSEVFSSPSYFLAFGLGSGLLRPGSGTWGSILAALLWPLLSTLPWGVLGVLILVSFVVGCVVCDQAGKRLGVDDHVGMVWDEMVAVWMLFWVLPQNLPVLILGFVLFRFFDVTKPYPIRTLDARLKGGFGVMMDDVLAALFAWVLTLGILLVLSYLGVGV
ncbi:phosphatidylglycerophosphatase A family protein [Orrella marina]|uniref:Phosphatidylglycerophosphatase A n=1 Tax=Orrella marina TaxID=2163011 RepID=A0A2R4XPT3_9BURK|nr:phosphatidylglycerophosphatase A [Orrella marina]AWB35795.1 phosphatidylglycerophosphatase A [Orrella marina]